MRKKVAIAGASGFVGRGLIEALRSEYDLVALSRRDWPAEPGLIWRHCDLFSLLQAENALSGVDYAIYLVHSPPPTARLTQGSYADLDLILADNFVRAARLAGVKHIIYLGNLIPAARPLPAYLCSRLEVEQVLSAYDVPVTLLRAPLMLGPGGAPVELARRLARLPLLPAPRWTRTLQRPLGLDDTLELVRYVMGREDAYGQTYDLAGPRQLSYLELIQSTARLEHGRTRPVLPLPFDLPGLSLRLAAYLSKQPADLLLPVIESLRSEALPVNTPLQDQLGQRPADPFTLLHEALQQTLPPAPSPLTRVSVSLKDVRSVQRLPIQPGQDALWLAEQYALLLPRLLRPFIHATVEADRTIRIHHLGIWRPMLELDYSESRSTPDRALYYITGGLLAGRDIARLRGRMEFRVVPGQRFALAAIHDFTPSLPWQIYRLTQAYFHLWTMKAFIHFLEQHREPASA